METLVKAGRKAYGICIVALGVQGMYYVDFDPVFLPGPLSWLPFAAPLAYVWSTILILAGLSIILEKKAQEVSLALGGIFLTFFLFCHVPHLLFVSPNGNVLGSWTKAFKELAFSGGAFVVAGSYCKESVQTKSTLINLLKKFIPFGKVFFSITMIAFGIDHFLYREFVASLVPAWIPDHIFWTYFTGSALIGSGIAIIAKIQLKIVASLLGAMIFLWLIFLHIPRAIADPFGDRGNEMTSVFQSFGFSGVAFIIAFNLHSNKIKELSALKANSKGQVLLREDLPVVNEKV
ncbi:MAG: hypothetical protein M3N30_13460 [Bacteroidota bacterium]|nr:hypothetical protein [Bacteroidota bacterium]